MNKLESRLKEDAARIEAEVSPRLAAKIADAVRRTRRARGADSERGLSFPLWLAGSLTGVAGAFFVIVLLNRADRGAEPPEQAVALTVPDYVRRMEQGIPLHAETADLTEPLEEELENLRSDIEKARESVERDLAFTF